jgi:hypothetical protein
MPFRKVQQAIICSASLCIALGAQNYQGQASTDRRPWKDVSAEIAEQARIALCPTLHPESYRVEYVDAGPSVWVGTAGGFRIVISKEFDWDLDDPFPSPTRRNPFIRVREYIELVVFYSDQALPIDVKERIGWSGFTSRFYLEPVDMGSSKEFRWFGRMHLWEQEDLRGRLHLVGGDDRLALAHKGRSVKDRGGMTSNSMEMRLGGIKISLGLKD